uniref:Cation transporter family protein n=1 Tax=Heterorhabditis bacteriophora TaxID=37862 RepID=A0A1I7XM46_HETBA
MDSGLRVISIFSLYLQLWLFYQLEASPDEYRLLSDLRHNYDSYERPVANASEPLVVSVKIYLQQILDVDEKNQVITLVAWIEYQWTDYKLKWDPTEYGGVKDIRIPGNANAIWKPDVLLYNSNNNVYISADENFDSTYPVNYVVSHSGHVLQVPPGILKLSCKIDITYFPFDDQMCHLKNGEWNLLGAEITYIINLAVPARNETNVFDDQPYPSLYFYLVIQRRTLYYGLNLIIPSLLISLMTVLGFTLPPDAGEKITLEITILLSVCFFLSMVADMTPPTSEAVPLIGAFFSCCMLVVSASVVFTVLVLNLHNRKPETHEMSPFAAKAEELLRKLGRRNGKTMLPREDGFTPSDSLSLFKSIKAQKIGNHTIEMEHMPGKFYTNFVNKVYIQIQNMYFEQKTRHFVTSLSCKMHISPLLLLRNLQLTSKNLVMIRIKSNDEQAENDWKFAAMVVDRLCLFTFTIFIVVSTCGIMFSSPHLIA